MNTNFYLRHKELFNPISSKFKIIVLGAGSLGSWITLNLSKMGFNDIIVYDYDKVEELNIGPQIYRPSDVGKFKVDALKEIIKSFSNIDIENKNEKVNKKTEFPMGLNNFYILVFDTLKERKMIFNMLKNICSGYVMDVRCGLEEYNIQTINLMNADEVQEWEKSFDIIPAELPCGMQAICYTNFSVTAEVCNIIKKINNNENYPKRLIRHMKSYRIINNQGK